MPRPTGDRAAGRRAPTARPAHGARRDPEPGPARDSDTEQRILDAAHAVFLRRGTAGARMQEIARAAGVNQALLHYYFRSKARLAEAVFHHVAARLVPPVIAILGSDLPLETKVERVVAHYLGILAESPFLPGYLIGEMAHHPERAPQLFASMAGARADAIAPRVLATLGRQLAERARAGTLRPIAPEQFMINLVSLCLFPFAARPLLSTVLGLDDAAFTRMMKRRRTELPAFFLAALRP